MSFVNVGAKLHGSDIPTKSALKAAIATNPDKVVLYGTSMFGTFKEGDLVKADNLDEQYKYQVTGPNPYTSRKWYATVQKGQNGNITVK